MRSISAFIFLAFLGAAPAPVTVNIKDMKFAPKTVSVARGSTVVWKNDDQVAHMVAASDGSWASPVIEPGRTFRKKFTAKGKVEIICAPHPTMRNTVIVK